MTKKELIDFSALILRFFLFNFGRKKFKWAKVIEFCVGELEIG